jgi:excisionase family DNA binding protein
VLGSTTLRYLTVAEAARASGFSRRAVYRAIERGELATGVVCSWLRIHPTDFVAWMEGSRAAATASSHSGDRIGVREAPAADGLRGLLTRAELGGVSVGRVQRRTVTVWRVGWRENGRPRQLGMFAAIACDERLRNAMCDETGR